MHPVLIGADVHHVRIHHRVLPTGVLVPQGGGKAQGPLAVGSSQVQQLQLLAQAGGAGGQHGAPGQPLNVVRVLSGVLVVQQGVTGHVQLGEHIHAHVLAHLGQRPPLVLGVGGVALIVLVVVVVVGVDEIGGNARMLGLRGEAGELLALQAVEAGVGLKGGGADVGVVVVIDMQVELVHLVPQHDLGVVLEQLIAVGGTGHVQHDAPHLIGGIVPHDALGNGHMVLGLPQNLLGGNGAIQATSIGGGIDVQPLLIGHHQVALLPQVIGGGVGEGLQIDVVGPGGGGARLHRQGEAGDLLHIGHQVLGHLVQAHIGLVVEDDLGVGGEGKAALIAVPLLDGGNDLWLGVGVGHRGEPLSGIVGGVVGHGDGDILLGIAGLVSPVGKAQQQRHVPSANVPRADGAVIGHHVLQFAAPHHQVRPGDGGQSDLGISQAGIGHSDFIQFSIHVHRGVNVGIGAHERNLGNVHIVAAGGLGVGLVDVQPHIPAQLGLTQSGLGRGGDGVGIAGRVCDVLPLSVDQSGIGRGSADIGHLLPGIGILRGVGGLELIFHGPHLVAGIGDLHGLKLRAGGSQVHLEPLRGLGLLVLGVVGDLEVLQVRGVPLGGLGAVHRIGCGGPLHGPAGRHRAVEGQVPGLLGGFFRLFGIHLNLPQAHVVAGSGGVHLFHIEAHIPLHRSPLCQGGGGVRGDGVGVGRGGGGGVPRLVGDVLAAAVFHRSVKGGALHPHQGGPGVLCPVVRRGLNLVHHGPHLHVVPQLNPRHLHGLGHALPQVYGEPLGGLSVRGRRSAGLHVVRGPLIGLLGDAIHGIVGGGRPRGHEHRTVRGNHSGALYGTGRRLGISTCVCRNGLQGQTAGQEEGGQRQAEHLFFLHYLHFLSSLVKFRFHLSVLV